jgi:PemK-like, MazF-like toxin of type II toxin-antitoxin system
MARDRRRNPLRHVRGGLRRLGLRMRATARPRSPRGIRVRPPSSTGDIRRAHPDGYPGDFTGTSHVVYTPRDDHVPDPGEIVWTWVPFEEDVSIGKDRPVLVVGYDGPYPLALMLTSKDHDEAQAMESDKEHGRDFVDIGSGPWDAEGRASEVRADRVIRLDPEAVRREGGVLQRQRYEVVAEHLRQLRGWT